MESDSYRAPGMLTWGRFSRFHSPALIGSPPVWRVGSIMDSSSFFHAILTATDDAYRGLPVDDRSAGERGRLELVKEIRRGLSHSFTKDEFESIHRGTVISQRLAEELRRIETSVYKILAYPGKYAKSRTRKWVYDSLGDADYRSILKLLGRDLFDLENVLINGIDMSSIFVRDNLNRLTKIVSELDRHDLADLGVEAVRDIGLGFRRLLTTAISTAYERITDRAREQIADVTAPVDLEILPFYEKRFGLNIRLMDGASGMLVPAKRREGDSVLLLSVGSGFECLGLEVGEEALKCKFEATHSFSRLLEADSPGYRDDGEEGEESGSEETRSPSPER